MLSARFLVKCPARGVAAGASLKPRHEADGRPPAPVTQLSEHELMIKDTGRIDTTLFFYKDT